MELSTNIPKGIDQRLLNMHVDVFEFDLKRQFFAIDQALDSNQFGFDLCELILGENPLLGQHLCVGNRSANVVPIESMVERNTLAELSQRLIHVTGENTAAR
jgi:hypothetical protein